MNPAANISNFVPKEDPELPDSYGIKVWYHGEKDPQEFEVAGHQIIDKIWVPENTLEGRTIFKYGGALASPYIEIRTKEDTFHIIPFASYKKIEFDKRYSKVVALRESKRNEAPK